MTYGPKKWPAEKVDALVNSMFLSNSEQWAAAILDARAERDHWKANHDHMRDRLAAITMRPDVPPNMLERIDIFTRLTSERDALAKRVEEQSVDVHACQCMLKRLVAERDMWRDRATAKDVLSPHVHGAVNRMLASSVNLKCLHVWKRCEDRFGLIECELCGKVSA